MVGIAQHEVPRGERVVLLQGLNFSDGVWRIRPSFLPMKATTKDDDGRVKIERKAHSVSAHLIDVPLPLSITKYPRAGTSEWTRSGILPAPGILTPSVQALKTRGSPTVVMQRIKPSKHRAPPYRNAFSEGPHQTHLMSSARSSITKAYPQRAPNIQGP